MSQLTSKQAQKLMDDLQVVISDAEDLLSATADDASEAASGVRKNLLERLNLARAEMTGSADLVVCHPGFLHLPLGYATVPRGQQAHAPVHPGAGSGSDGRSGPSADEKAPRALAAIFSSASSALKTA